MTFFDLKADILKGKITASVHTGKCSNGMLQCRDTSQWYILLCVNVVILSMLHFDVTAPLILKVFKPNKT